METVASPPAEVLAAQRVAGSYYSSLRRRRLKACASPECSATFATVGRGLYCSARCRWRAGHIKAALAKLRKRGVSCPTG